METILQLREIESDCRFGMLGISASTATIPLWCRIGASDVAASTPIVGQPDPLPTANGRRPPTSVIAGSLSRTTPRAMESEKRGQAAGSTGPERPRRRDHGTKCWQHRRAAPRTSKCAGCAAVTVRGRFTRSYLYGRRGVNFVDRLCQGSIERRVAHRRSQLLEQRAREACDHAMVASQALAGIGAGIASR